ncbi:LacI family DNA-binding transcriptional regulator [Rhizobium paknamense]|uniref:LacI family gluconate utilization system Gnt-I transcriptional repressor n=1 Tax=Rhizobium paknamense TaxID=1206817 RepID=A0ABU0IAB9_9HYPH|nr:LacI family DNA-binding transcriptional regulator [Rhizobium paknamense]MDQ0455172.1 LacI family gluconate utilization system Gnt-I transcriptional repressor [Rhizobium paknamense]
MTEVAQQVGVSPITVSRALNKPEKVSEALREAILKAVEETGYVPDFAARALASRHSNLVGVLTSLLGSAIFPPVMRGLEDRARDSGIRLQYANTRYDPKEEIYQLKQFYGQNPTGILIGGVQMDPGVMDMLSRAPCPVVQFIDITMPPVDMAIGINNAAAATTATQHLLSQGYRRIGFAAARLDIPVRMRLSGFQHTLQDAGIFDPNLIFLTGGDTVIPAASRVLDGLFAAAPDLDAIFCATDEMATGLLFECQRRGISVPDQMGLCGFTGLEFSGYTVPALTTVQTPLYDLGFKGLDMVLRTRAGRPTPKILDLGFQLITRDTTRRTGG